MKIPEPWHENASCAQVGPAVMDLDEVTTATALAARSVCEHCPAAALVEEESFPSDWRSTMRGGLLASERTLLAKDLRRAGLPAAHLARSQGRQRAMAEAALADADSRGGRERVRHARTQARQERALFRDAARPWNLEALNAGADAERFALITPMPLSAGAVQS